MAAKRKKKITLSEFKTWLAGVQSMQPEGWHPSKENWQMILDQVDNIVETVIEKEVVVHKTDNIEQQTQQPHNQYPTMDMRNPANQQIRPAPPSTELLNAMPTNNRPTGIDTNVIDSDGDYESSFAG